VADQALAGNASDLEGFLAEADSEDPSKTVKDTLNDMIAVIGEKLDIRRF
jgi:elongation factor Ts